MYLFDELIFGHFYCIIFYTSLTMHVQFNENTLVLSFISVFLKNFKEIYTIWDHCNYLPDLFQRTNTICIEETNLEYASRL